MPNDKCSHVVKSYAQTTQVEKDFSMSGMYASCNLQQQPVCKTQRYNTDTNVRRVKMYFLWLKGMLHEMKPTLDTTNKAKYLRRDKTCPQLIHF